ncbi:MAG: hypothetical protein AAFX06_03485 [Planctomycetota bacterium]
MVESKPSWSAAQVIIAILFFAALALMVFIKVSLSNRRSVLVEENERIAADVSQTREEVQTFKELRRQNDEGKDSIKEMMSLCREAEDVPEFESWLVSSSRSGQELFFFVPEGEHWLSVTTTSPRKPTSHVVPFRGMERKLIRLVPNAGYKFEIVRPVLRGRLGWKLVSNDPSFETVERRLPQTADWSGRSWSSTERVVFPNQFVYRDLFGFQSESPRLQLMDTTERGRIGRTGLALEIAFEVAIISNTPSVFSANEAITIRNFRNPDLIGDYAGNGRYYVNQEAVDKYIRKRGK